MEERVGFIVSSLDQLAERLTAYVNGDRNIPDAHYGRIEPGAGGMTTIGVDDAIQDAIEKWIERGKLSKLLALWLHGLEIDWTRLYGGVRPRRVSLPTYPFA